VVANEAKIFRRQIKFDEEIPSYNISKEKFEELKTKFKEEKTTLDEKYNREKLLTESQSSIIQWWKDAKEDAALSKKNLKPKKFRQVTNQTNYQDNQDILFRKKFKFETTSYNMLKCI